MAITPKRDGTLVELLEYLKVVLNQASLTYYNSIGELPQTAVEGLECGQTELAGVRKFPLLVAYRTGYSGSLFDRSTANIDYFLLASVKSHRGQESWFTWVAKQIAIALDDYNNIDGGCLNITEIGPANPRYAQVRGSSGPLTIPFLRVQIAFEDFGRVA